MSIIAIFLPTHCDGCHVTKFALETNLMGGVAVRSIVADHGLGRYLWWARWCHGGGRNCHGVEVFRCDYIFFGQVETGMFLYVGRCNTKVGTILPYGTQLNSYHTFFGNVRHGTCHFSARVEGIFGGFRIEEYHKTVLWFWHHLFCQYVISRLVAQRARICDLSKS